MNSQRDSLFLSGFIADVSLRVFKEALKLDFAMEKLILIHFRSKLSKI